VGGVVRDLLLERDNCDLDLVLEGDAMTLAGELADLKQGKVTTHPRFGTAKLLWDGWSADFTTARSETYPRPCALPTVKPASIEDDLRRRDFTINAMAVELGPGAHGRLLDPFSGRDDLERKLIRVLHDKSFTDDATRIWRALRYEQRLDFRLEPTTLELLKRDTGYLTGLSGDRIRHELELVFKEELPEKALRRADELGALAQLHPSLRGDDWLAEKYARARELSSPEPPSGELLLALLAYRLNAVTLEQLIARLRPRRAVARALRDTLDLKAGIGALAAPGIPRSRLYYLLIARSSAAVRANGIASGSAAARGRIALFLRELRHCRSDLSGSDLTRLGVPRGPDIREMLHRLIEARLDGRVTTKRDEEDLIAQWSAGIKE
jgi:tRNA nucleotidyltransferase (CCA-adding enzyme)